MEAHVHDSPTLYFHLRGISYKQYATKYARRRVCKYTKYVQSDILYVYGEDWAEGGKRDGLFYHFLFE